MKQHTDIKQKAEEALHSLDGMQRASVSPYFFTRLESRMQGRQTFWDKLIYLITRPAIAFAGIALILFVNVYIIASDPENNLTTTGQTEFASVDEYSRVSLYPFEYENLKP